MTMRGLDHFIRECLECHSKEEEKARVTKELANIRKNFNNEKLSGYDRKKYVAKLLYIHLLGYTYDFGFPQMIDLLTSHKFSEKQIGYITLGVILNGNYELVTMLIQHLSKEMKNIENEPAQCLALSAAANIGGQVVAETLGGPILQVLQSPRSTEFVRKKAALALVRIYRENPGTFVLNDQIVEMLSSLIQDHSFGVQLSGASLVLQLMPKNRDGLSKLFGIILQMLQRILFEMTVPADYTYGRNPIPWLITKYLRILNYKSEWSKEETDRISRIIDVCLQKCDLLLNVKEVNTNMMLLFEAINLVVATSLSPEFLTRAATILGGFLSAKQPNIRYLSLETLTRLVTASRDVIPHLEKHRQTLYLALRDPDNSIRRRTLSLLYVLCTQNTAEEIVGELLNYLSIGADITMREPLCLKIAVLAESFAPDLAWFVDVVLQLIALAGDQCHDGVWQRVVQVVSLNPQLQRYATKTSYNSMTALVVHDRLIMLTAQLVGEYFHQIQVDPNEIVAELIKKYEPASLLARGMILSALAKIGARCEPVRGEIIEFLNKHRSDQNINIQQRAIEYSALLSAVPQVFAQVFQPIPPFKARASALIKLVARENQDNADDEEEEEEEEDGDQQQLQQQQFQQQQMQQQQMQQQQQMPPQQMQQQMQQGENIDPMSFATAYPASPIKSPEQEASNYNAPEPVDDLLGFNLGGPQQQQNMGGEPDLLAPPVQQQSANLLEVMDISSGPVKAMTSPEQVFKAFLTSEQGIVYEDANAALSLNIQTNGANALMTFVVSNKGSAPLSQVKMHIPPVPFFRASARPGAPNVAPGGVMQYQFAITVTAPYSEPPDFIFGYSVAGNDVKESCKLPLVMSKFVGPFNMDSNTFFGRWQAINAPNQTTSAAYKPQPGQDITREMTNLMVNLLHIPVLNIPVPQFNVVGAGIISCESGAQGLLARFYADPASQMVKIEVKGTSFQITAAFQYILDKYFK